MPHLSLKHKRLVHNAFIFTISLFISFYSHIPFAFWVSATVLAIMLPMDSSQIQERISGVFFGTIHGLVLFIPIWITLDINSNLIFLIIPFSLAIANFCQIHNFSRNIAFLNINLGLFLEYMQYGNYHFSAYFVARLMTILIGIFLAYFGDLFFTNRKDYAKEEFYEAIKNLDHTVKKSMLEFGSLHRLEINTQHEIELINHINKINTLTINLNNHFKSMKIEQKDNFVNQIHTHYETIPPLLIQYKLELFAIGYAITSKLVITDYRLNTLTIKFQEIGNQLLNSTQIILNKYQS